VGTGPVAIGALLGAIAGAALGAYVQRRWTAETTDDDEIRERLAKLETEIEELEFRQRQGIESRRESALPVQTIPLPARRRPFPEVRGDPPGKQYLVLTADRDFRLSRVDYVSDQGTVISEDVEMSGRRIEVLINEKKISRVWYLVPRWNEAAQFQFRCHLSVDGIETQSVVPAMIRQNYMWFGPARTIFRKVSLTTQGASVHAKATQAKARATGMLSSGAPPRIPVR
jgi:hypothetical protein